VMEGVPEEVKHTLPSTHMNFKVAELGDRRHNNCRKAMITHLQSLEEELEDKKNVMSNEDMRNIAEVVDIMSKK